MRLLIFISLILSLSVYGASSNTSKKASTAPKNPASCEETGEVQQLAGTVLSAVGTIKGCPNFSKLEGLCGAVSDLINDSSGGNPFEYSYQRAISEAACVDLTKDSPEVAQKKIQLMWTAFEDKLTCNTFDVTNGSILKYAVNVKQWQFLDDAMKKWKINLNRVDPSDNRTLLDYILYLKSKYEGTDIGILMDAYTKKLIKSGAKRQSEL